MPQYLAQWMEPAGRGQPPRLRRARVGTSDPRLAAQALGLSDVSSLQIRRLGWTASWWTGAVPSGGGTSPGGGPSRRAIDLRQFHAELAVLLAAGIPLLEALQTLRERGGGGTGMLEQLARALREGLSLSAAMQRAGAPFDPLAIALVGAGERSGQLVATLQSHAAYLAWLQALGRQLRSALSYPLLLLAASLAVVLFLLLFVLPRFASVFDGVAADVPTASRWLIGLGVQAASQPTLSLVLAAAPALALWAVSRSVQARRVLAGLLWRSPGVGPWMQLVALARLYRALSLTLGAGLGVSRALTLVGEVLPEPLRPAIAAVGRRVQAGERLSDSLDAEGLATPVARRMLRVGEQGGALPAMLQRAAEFHDGQIAHAVDLVGRLAAPVLMLLMGALIGGIVVLMYMPIFGLMEQLG